MALDRCQITRAAPGVTGARSARAATPQAPLTPERRPPGTGAARAWGSRCLAPGGGRGWQGWRAEAGWRLWPSLPLYIRGSGSQVCLGRMVPLTWTGNHLGAHIIYGDLSCHGERPGTPPARAGHEGQLRRRSSRPTRTRLARGRPRPRLRARPSRRRAPGARTGRAAAAAPSTTGPGSPGRRGLAAAQHGADRRGVPVGGRRVGQRGADRFGAGLGDVPAAGPLARGVLGGDQPGVAHERPGGGAAPVHHLGGQRQPGQLGDAPVAAQRATGPASGSRAAHGASSASIAVSSASRTSSAAR